ncbi:hypothetical protein AKO1_008999 [Acrasis kona]|uniref:F-box domain-containing protein n=1 Tax=Acrasis kona TaxID=1008807 RepID=A0AAW2ZI10_9EUKA
MPKKNTLILRTLPSLTNQLEMDEKHQQILINVDIVAYVISLNEYDQLTDANSEMNRLEHSLNCFENVVNKQDIIGEADFYLIFNKRDLFMNKIIWNDLFTCAPFLSKYKKSDLMLPHSFYPNLLSKDIIQPSSFLKRDCEELYALLDRLSFFSKKSEVGLTGTYVANNNLTRWKSRNKTQTDLRPAVQKQRIWTVSDLSKDMILHIFFFLNANDVCIVNNVCYEWYILSGADCLWSRLCLQEQPNLTQEFVDQVTEEVLFQVRSKNLKQSRTVRRKRKTSREGIKEPVIKRPLIQELRKASLHTYRSYYMTVAELTKKNIKFLVDRYLERVYEPEKKETLRERVFVINSLNEEEVVETFQNIVSMYLKVK